MKNGKIKQYTPCQFHRLLACYNHTVLAWKTEVTNQHQIWPTIKYDWDLKSKTIRIKVSRPNRYNFRIKKLICETRM